MSGSSPRLPALLLATLLAWPAQAWPDDEARADTRTNEALVEALDAEEPNHRAAAETELRRRGAAALAALRAARSEAKDMARARIDRIIGRIVVDLHKANVPDGMAYVPAGPLEVPRDSRPWGPSGKRIPVGAFYIDKHEVTVGAWRAYRQHLTEGGKSESLLRHLWDPPADMPADLPAVRVRWLEASAFAKWRKGRLPTAEEFERALRGSGLAKWPWGDDAPEGRANLLDIGPGRLLPVASLAKGASAFGVHDLVGNAAEWSATVIRQGQRGRYPLVLGGSYRDRASSALTWRGLDRMQPRIGSREALPHVGFRVARDVAPQAEGE